MRGHVPPPGSSTGRSCASCEGLPTGRMGDPHADPSKPTGRYGCLAVTSEVPATSGNRGASGTRTGSSIDFTTGRYAFCKVRGRPGELAIRARSSGRCRASAAADRPCPRAQAARVDALRDRAAPAVMTARVDVAEVAHTRRRGHVLRQIGEQLPRGGGQLLALISGGAPTRRQLALAATQDQACACRWHLSRATETRAAHPVPAGAARAPRPRAGRRAPRPPMRWIPTRARSRPVVRRRGRWTARRWLARPSRRDRAPPR